VSNTEGHGAVHPAAAEGFARGAQTYVRGRPDFPPVVREWLRDDLDLHQGKVVLELGAGTGKFTTHLVATGARVIALDPVAQMLEQLTRKVSEATPLLGSAASIPLADHTVDAVVCAQSFHWFATATALAEMARVLKPGGVLGLIWNVRDQSADWVAALTRLIAPYEGNAPRYDHGEWRGVFPAQGFTPLIERRVAHGHTGSPEHVIIDRIASISFIAALEDAERARLIGRVRELIASTPSLAGREEVTFPYVTMVYHCTRP
jgi:SAM-dependent methyltransferase